MPLRWVIRTSRWVEVQCLCTCLQCCYSIGFFFYTIVAPAGPRPLPLWDVSLWGEPNFCACTCTMNFSWIEKFHAAFRAFETKSIARSKTASTLFTKRSTHATQHRNSQRNWNRLCCRFHFERPWVGACEREASVWVWMSRKLTGN